MTDLATKNRRIGLAVLGIVMAMVGLAYLSVPLYRIFCQVTGIGGPAQMLVASPPPSLIRDQPIEVRFDAHVDTGLPWDFAPEVRALTLKIGEEGLVAFRAHNQTKRPLTGTAVYNVLPEKAAKYFHKTQCFCFGEQTLTPGQAMDMPVMFYVDPEILNDPNTSEVRSFTLSYTFYRTDSAELDQAIEKFQAP